MSDTKHITIEDIEEMLKEMAGDSKEISQDAINELMEKYELSDGDIDELMEFTEDEGISFAEDEEQFEDDSDSDEIDFDTVDSIDLDYFIDDLSLEDEITDDTESTDDDDIDLFEEDLDYFDFDDDYSYEIIKNKTKKKNNNLLYCLNQLENKYKEDDIETIKYYINRLLGIDVVTKESEITLCERIIDGDYDARKEFTEVNLYLVISIAMNYLGNGLSFTDLVQEGNLGLYRATESFDYTKGYRFSTYAYYWINQSIARAIENKGRMIRLPVYVIENIIIMNKAKTELTQKLKREPSIKEIADRMDGMNPFEISLLETYCLSIISLDAPINDKGDTTLIETIEDVNAILPDYYAANELLKDEINEVILELTDREEKVLRLRFGLDDGRTRTLEEVGKEFNVTRERIRQIEAKALRKLKHPSRSKRLRDYLDNVK